MVTTRPAAQSYIIKRPRLTKLLDESEARIILLVRAGGVREDDVGSRVG